MAQWTLEDAGNSDLPVQYGYVMSPEKTANTGKRA
jgi:hypothetical protein